MGYHKVNTEIVFFILSILLLAIVIWRKLFVLSLPSSNDAFFNAIISVWRHGRNIFSDFKTKFVLNIPLLDNSVALFIYEIKGTAFKRIKEI